MKILYIAPIRLPTEKAHGIQIMETCAALSRAGVHVELLIPGRKTSIREDPFAFYHIKNRFTITRLSAPDTVSWGRLGYLFHVMVFGFRAALYARKAFAVAYTRDPITVSLCSILGVSPLAWEVHTAHPGVPRRVMHSVLGIIPITQGLARWYAAHGVLQEALHVAPDAVDLGSFVNVDREAARASLRSKLNISPDSPIALYVGSFGLYAWKGVDVAREAAAHAPAITWLFVGGSPEECERLLHGASPNVRTLPRTRREDIPALISGADVLLLPNKSGDPASERDTSPMKLFEYMASGVPIVASDISSLREVLDEQNAFLVPPNDPRALARTAQEVFSQKDAASQKAAAARTAVAAYTWDERAKGMQAFLEHRLARS